jgi:hypothetical protein
MDTNLGGARLPNSFVILTKALACLVCQVIREPRPMKVPTGWPRKRGSAPRVSPIHPFGYSCVTHSRDAPMLAVDCDSVMLIVSWMSNLELIAANS